jgi:hypothetical protein
MSESNQTKGKTHVRSFKIIKKEAYAYKHTSCIKSIKVKRHRQLQQLILCINGVYLKCTNSDTNYYYWDFKDLRDNIREYLGETPYENECMCLEKMFTYNQLKAIQHYTLDYNELKSSIFTNECIVQFVPDNQNIDTLEAEEVIYYSDQQLKSKEEEKK